VQRKELRRFLAVIILFAGIGLAFTLISLPASPQALRVGTLRPLGTIPAHELELLETGLGIGLLASAASRRLDLSLILLPVFLTPLLDLDHLPAALGAAQPIRPAHSVFFILALVLGLRLAGQPIEIELLSVSAFLGHLGVDTGRFPLLSPFSFAYYPLSPYDVEILAASLLIGLSAGLYSHRRIAKPRGADLVAAPRLPVAPQDVLYRRGS